MSFEFHKEHYERYERLLLVAQTSGNWALAREAARMVLFHLRNLFQSLPHSRQQAVRSGLTSLAPDPVELPVAAFEDAASSSPR
jgi:hypothetical protein